MPPYKLLVTTRNQRKRKALELQTNAPVKKARVSKMKELATMYKTGKECDRNNDTNESNYFDIFFMKQKVVYPWLTKESLRWHVRVLNSQKKQNMTTTTTEVSCDNKTRFLESIVIDHNQEVRSYEI